MEDDELEGAEEEAGGLGEFGDVDSDLFDDFGDDDLLGEGGGDESSDAGEMSQAKRDKVLALHAEGVSPREIAETLGITRDEVKMAIRLAES